MELMGPYLAACILLVVAGASKVVRPTDTARAVAAIAPFPLGALRLLVRVGAALEVAIGLGGLLYPSLVTASLVALSYALFGGFVVAVIVRGGPLASCGCFGKPDTPATRVHVVVNVGLAAAAVVVAVSISSAPISTIMSSQPWHGIPLALLGALGALTGYLALSPLAELLAARRLLGITRGRQA